MTAPYSRKWYQLHGTTLFALIVISIALVWANLRQPEGIVPGDTEFGWPWRAFSNSASLHQRLHIHPAGLAGDVLVVLSILLFNAAYFESRVRNRERVWELKNASREGAKITPNKGNDSGLG